MAAYHTRSNSFPSRQHPLVPEFDEQLSRLRSSEEASSSSIACKLSGLQDLHDCVEKLLLLPLNQQALSKERNEKCVDELLDGSLRLLDVCNISKDALLQLKESTQELRLLMRRRRSGERNLSSEVKKFLNSRKAAKKALHKAMENKYAPQVSLTRIKKFWSFVSKLMNSKKVICEEFNESNEFASTDAALNLLISHKTKKSDSTVEEKAQNQLQKLEICIQDLEEGVESLYRRLIKTRVALLNILNH
ncbi:hypothetical protein TIFTF001_007505 [Ficus carica]|uniref:Uncharacterized protein n=1 Tax=Ficus carica TaxID=3494 RepID=A0AA88D224_FICCA|nr:hypothetical protein TIFTF001_007505 [Ficus carica]